MIQEITVAADFISHLVSKMLDPKDLENFHKKLRELLSEKFVSHWDPQRPIYGNAYRSIIFSYGYVDPIVLQAAHKAKVTLDSRWIPSDLTIWIDPSEVSYRIGDSGSIATLPLPKEQFSSPENKPSNYSRRIEVH